MTDPKREMALQIIEKARAILSDLPDPQVSTLEVHEYPALGHRVLWLTLKVGEREFRVKVEEDITPEGA